MKFDDSSDCCTKLLSSSELLTKLQTAAAARLVSIKVLLVRPIGFSGVNDAESEKVHGNLCKAREFRVFVGAMEWFCQFGGSNLG